MVPPALKLILLQNAVSNVPDLHHIKTQVLQISMTNKKGMDFDMYFKLLSNAALEFDGKTKRGRNPTRPRRSIYQHEQDIREHDMDTSLDKLDPDNYHVFEVNQTVRVPEDRWNKLSDAGKKSWHDIKPDDCVVILGTSTGSAPSGQPNKGTPQKGPQRCINLHELTHGEYLALKHEVMQESNMCYNVYNSDKIY